MLANHPNSHEFGYGNPSRRCPLGQRTALCALVLEPPYFFADPRLQKDMGTPSGDNTFDTCRGDHPPVGRQRDDGWPHRVAALDMVSHRPTRPFIAPVASRFPSRENRA